VRAGGPVDRVQRHAPVLRHTPVLRQAHDVAAGVQLHQRLPADGGQQQLLEIGLGEHRRLRPAVRSGRRRAGELGEHPVAPVEQPQPPHRAADREEALGDAGVGERAQGLVVQVHRAGLSVGRGLPFQHQHPQPAPGEQQRRRQPHRPGADDDHGDSRHGGTLAARGRRGSGNVAPAFPPV
jgi:hypothetical protein